MSWKVVALSATAGICLFPDFARAQSNPPAADKATEPAPENDAAPAVKGDASAAPGAAPDANQNAQPSLGDQAAQAASAKVEKLLDPNSYSWKDISKKLRFGPSVAIGVPHPVTGALDIVYADFISLSLSGGRFGTKVEETDLEIRNWDATLRWFPFAGSFFVGAARGQQGVVGKRKIDLDVTSGGAALKVPTTLRLEIESDYLTPQIGWFARWDSGFTLGFDIGYQMPSGAKSDLQTSFENVSAASEEAVRNSAEYKKNKKDVEDAAEAIGKTAIPYVSFLRIGWLF